MTRAVDDVLEEIGAGDSPRLLVLNKADLLDDERRRELAFRHPEGLLVSAVTGEGLEELGERDRRVGSSARCATSSCSSRSREGQTLSELHDVAGDLEREDTAEGVRVTARLPAVVAERYDRYANGDGDSDARGLAARGAEAAGRRARRPTPAASSTTARAGATNGTSSSWAIRSPGSPSYGSAPRLTSTTRISPR